MCDGEEVSDCGSERRKKKKKNQSRRKYGFRKAKLATLFPFSKTQKERKLGRNLSASNSSGEKGGCFCLKQPQTLGSPADSAATDPNDPNFTYEMMKTSIEKNDFYSRECNPHQLS